MIAPGKVCSKFLITGPDRGEKFLVGSSRINTFASDRLILSKGEILDALLSEYGIKKTQAYSEIKAAQKLAKDLYYAD